MASGNGPPSLHRIFISSARSMTLVRSNQPVRSASSISNRSTTKEATSLLKTTKEYNKSETLKPKKTQAQMDEELRAAMEGRAGDGGIAGAELEGGKAVAMKRGVRDNMFRYI